MAVGVVVNVGVMVGVLVDVAVFVGVVVGVAVEVLVLVGVNVIVDEGIKITNDKIESFDKKLFRSLH